MSKRLAAIIIGAGLISGCASSVPSTESSATTPAPATVSQTPADAASRFPQGQQAVQLGASLNSLKETTEEGILTSEEYASARARAVKDYCDWAESQRRNQSITAHVLHDEAGYLSELNKEHLLSDDEFKQAKAAVVKAFLAAGQ